MTITPTFACIAMEQNETAYTVKNRIVADNIEEATKVSKAIYGDNALAFEITFYPVRVGDVYISGSFFRENADGIYEQILSSGSYQEMITRLEASNNELRDNLDSALEAIAELYEIIIGGVEAGV